MTGGHVQGDLLAPEDVVSLLLDDAQLEQKLREAPLQRKASSDKQTPPKASQKVPKISDSFTGMNEPNSVDYELDNSAKNTDLQQQKPKRPKRTKRSINENIEPDLQQQKPKRPKRPKRSINENIEPAYTTADTVTPEPLAYPHAYESADAGLRQREEISPSNHSPT